jgi:hypothetical protein
LPVPNQERNRSLRAGRQGKSTRPFLTGQALRHDLSDLGYDRAFDMFRPRGRKASPWIIFYAA